MKLYYKATKPFLSNALRRIYDGLVLTAPEGIQFVEDESIADQVVAPIVSINDTKGLKDAHIFQLCYKTAGGTEKQWNKFWKNQKSVWSYLDLPYASSTNSPKYGRIPLGYDPNLFYDEGRQRRDFDILVTGYISGKGAEEIEMLNDVFDRVCHVGKDLKLGNGYKNFEQVSDDKMRELYNRSLYVAGLRYIEGFEFPIIEGAACGCQPITFYYECYTKWFNDLALFVTEKDLKTDLEMIGFRLPTNLSLVENFTWDKVLKPFWNNIMRI